MTIYQMTAGTWGNITSSTVTGAAGDLLCMEASGSTLTCFQNGVNVLSTTDSSYTTGQPGLVLNNAVGSIADNWSGGNLHPLAQLDTEQDWTKTQHFMPGVGFGTETINASPRSGQDALLPGPLTSTW